MPGLLRLLTCGSVDDGKSTLIGRLLYDTGRVPTDHLRALECDSARIGNADGYLDFALLVDGLEVEREQGITIDVAWRYFTTERRRFVVADAPGHEQYTRNMATGAANAELALVLVDARNGVLTQTRRHSFIAALMGIRHVVLAVNKIDMVGYSEERFTTIRDTYLQAVAGLGFRQIVAIPVSARFGDNVCTASAHTPWFTGPTLLELLETVEVGEEPAVEPFRMPVQWVNRPHQDFRGYAGTITAGWVRVGDALVVSPSGRGGTLARIVTMDGELEEAYRGDAVTLVLAEQLDVSRGDVLAAAAAPVPVADKFNAHLVWLAEAPLFCGRSYLFRIGTRTVSGAITRVRYRVDVNTFAHEAADTLGLNEVAAVNVSLLAAVALEPFAAGSGLGGFIVIDRMSNATVGVGMVEQLTPAATNIVRHRLAVDRHALAALKGQKPTVLWFTGLSGSGKSTIANLVAERLHALGRHAMLIDGDNLRHGLNRDLGFSEAERVENIRRAAEVTRLLADAGLIVLASFISPYRSDRAFVRERMEEGEFLEVFVDTPLEECRRRDPKGLYRRADAGLIHNFTGVDAPYEAPLAPDLRLAGAERSAEELADEVVETLRQRGRLVP
jgi:bifunctional enzyme CysN/CysC